MRIILFSDDHFGCGATYKDAFAKLEEATNGPPDCRNDVEEALEPPVPIGMVVTDDDTAGVDSYGRVVTKGGSWTLNIPLKLDRPPSYNYRFNAMQKWKDEDYQNELWSYRQHKYREEFDAFCKKSGLDDFCAHEECEFYGKDKATCFQAWWEKYKKAEEERECTKK